MIYDMTVALEQQFKQLKIKPEKIDTHTLGTGQFVTFIFTRGRNETWNEDDTNCGNTNLNEALYLSVTYSAILPNPKMAKELFKTRNKGCQEIAKSHWVEKITTQKANKPGKKGVALFIVNSFFTHTNHLC